MKIIDNALPLEDYRNIVDTLFSNRFGWNLCEKIASDNDGYYFVHRFYQNYGVESQHISLIVPIINILQPKAIIRIKANLYPSSEALNVHDFHSDQTYEHKGAIYYVNSNDGYTELEDGTKIKSVENKLMLFDSLKPHRSTGCTDANVRVTINFNYF
jgi:hypothetical protein